MSGVDVLSVMDRAANQARGVALDNQGSIALADHWADVTQARAAVAELIEAVTAQVNDPSGANIIRNKRRVMAALARVGSP